MRKLLAAGANINRQDSGGYSPLHLATERRKNKIIRFLIKQKANPDLQTREGNTPLIIAVRRGYGKAASILAVGGANLNLRGGTWVEPALISAIGRNSAELVKLLLDNGANPDLSRKLRKEPPLHIAIRRGQFRIVQLLLKKKANPDILDGGGFAALIRAIFKKDMRMIKSIIRAGANVNLRDSKSGATALHHAVARNQMKTVRMLLKHGAEINIRSKSGSQTPLWHAAKRNFLAMGRLLLRHGADIFLGRGRYSTSAYEIAVSRKFTRFARMLKKSVDPRVFHGWVQIPPIAGIEGIDFATGNYYDHNPRSSLLPSRIDTKSFMRFLNEKSKGKPKRRKLFLSLFRRHGSGKYYYPKKGITEKETKQAIGIFPITVWKYREFNRSDPRAIINYMGERRAYDGHLAADIFTAEENRDLGTPLVAVADGIVTSVAEPDPRPWGGGGNHVALKHKNGTSTSYIHINRGILVKQGQIVRAGQQIAWMGGNGTHVQFNVYEWNKPIDPYRGPRNRIVSRWRKQPPYIDRLSPRIDWWGLFDRDKKNKRGEILRRRYYRLGEKMIRPYIKIRNFKKGMTVTWKLVNPAGELWRTRTTNKSKHPYRYIRLSRMKLYPGIWTAKFLLDGKLIKQIPFTVIGENDSIPENRRPNRPASVKLKTISTPNHDIYVCRLPFPVIQLDPDNDRVTHLYSWYLNDKLMRKTRSVTLLDYFPAHMAKKGDRIRCEVRSRDRQYKSDAISVQAIVKRSGRKFSW